MRTSRKRRVVRLLVMVLPIFLIVFAGLIWAVFALWNSLMPAIFGLRAITYWQALGLMVALLDPVRRPSRRKVLGLLATRHAAALGKDDSRRARGVLERPAQPMGHAAARARAEDVAAAPSWNQFPLPPTGERVRVRAIEPDGSERSVLDVP